MELDEIESVLLGVPGIAQVVVDACHPAPGVTELAAYYSLRRGAAAPDPDQIYAHLRGRLPSYMVPAYLEQLAVIPVLPSGKTDRHSLPPPRGERRLAAHGGYVAPAEGIERDLAGLLADVLRIERVSADSHFFDDLGADSLLMAHFNAAIRARGDLPPVSMKDIYLHPTIRQLAAALPAASPAPGPVEGPAQPVDGRAQNPVRAGEQPGLPAERDAQAGRYPPVPAVRRPAATGLGRLRLPGRPMAEHGNRLGRRPPTACPRSTRAWSPSAAAACWPSAWCQSPSSGS